LGRWQRIRLPEVDRELTTIDDRTRGSQEVHSEDAADLEAVVHLADLRLEIIHAAISDREPIDMRPIVVDLRRRDGRCGMLQRP
jgi:hypothetical protein